MTLCISNIWCIYFFDRDFYFSISRLCVPLVSVKHSLLKKKIKSYMLNMKQHTRKKNKQIQILVPKNFLLEGKYFKMVPYVFFNGLITKNRKSWFSDFFLIEKKNQFIRKFLSFSSNILWILTIEFLLLFIIFIINQTRCTFHSIIIDFMIYFYHI